MLVDILSLLEGFALDLRRVQARNHSSVGVPVFYPWILSRYKFRTRILAATCIRPHPPCSFGFWSVDGETLKIFPRHTYNGIAVFNWHTLAAGGREICAVYHAFANRKLCAYRIL